MNTPWNTLPTYCKDEDKVGTSDVFYNHFNIQTDWDWKSFIEMVGVKDKIWRQVGRAVIHSCFYPSDFNYNIFASFMFSLSPLYVPLQFYLCYGCPYQIYFRHICFIYFCCLPLIIGPHFLVWRIRMYQIIFRNIWLIEDEKRRHWGKLKWWR